MYRPKAEVAPTPAKIYLNRLEKLAAGKGKASDAVLLGWYLAADGPSGHEPAALGGVGCYSGFEKSFAISVASWDWL